MSNTYDDAVRQFERLSYKKLAEKFRELKAEIEDLDQRKKALNEQFDALTLKVIPDKMMEDDVRTMTITGIGRIELRPNMWTSTKNPQALQQWLQEHDLEQLIVPSVNGSTLKATIKELQEAGEELPPPEVVSITPYIRATVVGKG